MRMAMQSMQLTFRKAMLGQLNLYPLISVLFITNPSSIIWISMSIIRNMIKLSLGSKNVRKRVKSIVVKVPLVLLAYPVHHLLNISSLLLLISSLLLLIFFLLLLYTVCHHSLLFSHSSCMLLLLQTGCLCSTLCLLL